MIANKLGTLFPLQGKDESHIDTQGDKGRNDDGKKTFQNYLLNQEPRHERNRHKCPNGAAQIGKNNQKQHPGNLIFPEHP